MSIIQKWFLIVGMWVVMLFLILAFYWTQIRPVQIRRMCAKEASQASAEIKSSVSKMLEVHQAVYSECLRRNGIEK
jgi:hypothetical protein